MRAKGNMRGTRSISLSLSLTLFFFFFCLFGSDFLPLAAQNAAKEAKKAQPSKKRKASDDSGSDDAASDDGDATKKPV